MNNQNADNNERGWVSSAVSSSFVREFKPRPACVTNDEHSCRNRWGRSGNSMNLAKPASTHSVDFQAIIEHRTPNHWRMRSGMRISSAYPGLHNPGTNAEDASPADFVARRVHLKHDGQTTPARTARQDGLSPPHHLHPHIYSGPYVCLPTIETTRLR